MLTLLCVVLYWLFCLRNFDERPTKCPPPQGFDEILRGYHFRAIPIEIVGDSLGAPAPKNQREGVVDSAKMCIKVEGEILYLGDAYEGILEGTKIKQYITRNENICPGRYFYQALQEFHIQDNCAASIWFHVYDGESDSLFIKWVEYGKENSDFWGLEYLFHRK